MLYNVIQMMKDARIPCGLRGFFKIEQECKVAREERMKFFCLVAVKTRVGFYRMELKYGLFIITKPCAKLV